MNKYQKWYNNICERGQTRITEEYTERHHIVPESFYKIRKRKGPAGWLDGDSDATENITRLTDREHELVHYLLTKIYKNNKRAYFKVLKGYEMRSLVNQNQTDKRHFSSRRLAGIRAERAKLQSEVMSGEGNPMYGTKWTDEQKKEHSEKITGRKQLDDEKKRQKDAWKKRKELGLKKAPMTETHRENLKKNHKSTKEDFDGSLSEETKQKIAEKATGRKQSEETIKAKADAIRGSKRDKKLCPHCNKRIAVNTYPRFHGDNCDQNPKSPRYKPNITKIVDFA